MNNCEKYIQNRLFELSDNDYKYFQANLMPTINEEIIIGVRTPLLRKLAKEIYASDYRDVFLNILPHKYYEENNLHAFLIENIKEYDTAINYIDAFLPYVDNWATCDSMSPKVLKKNTDRLIKKIYEWTSSNKTYTIRFGIGMLMNHFLDENYRSEYLDIVINIKSEEYYVNMMRAWFFATALSKQYNSAISVIENQILDKWTQNKTIQKAIDSYRINEEQKTYLRTLKIK